MTFNKNQFKSVKLHQNDTGKYWNEGGLVIELEELYEPYLLGTKYCDTIYIMWHPDNHGASNSPMIEILAVDNDHVSTAKKMYELDVLKALGWVAENLA